VWWKCNDRFISWIDRAAKKGRGRGSKDSRLMIKTCLAIKDKIGGE
jgi:hypothetical protein